MAITNESASHLVDTTGITKLPITANAEKRCQSFSFTQGAAAGDAGSTMILHTFPPGRVRLFASSRIAWSAFGAGRVLDVGYGKFTGPDAVDVAAAPTALDDDINVAAAGKADLFSDATPNSGMWIEIVSRTPWSVIATVAGGTIPAGATLAGWLDYTMR